MSALAIIGGILIGLIFFTVVAASLTCSMQTKGFEYLNPLFLYGKFRVNWFGVLLLTLLLNVSTLPIAFCYWVYKLCTAGRKD